MTERPQTTVGLRWEGGLRFTSSDAHGHTVTVDAPERDGEPFDGFKPGELLLTSLAGCSAIDVVDILRKQRQDVTGVDIQVSGSQQAEAPWTWEEIHLAYVVRGRGIRRSAVERAIELSQTKYCSVGATIEARCRITSTVQIIEEGDADSQQPP
jgi:putative redox protein